VTISAETDDSALKETVTVTARKARKNLVKKSGAHGHFIGLELPFIGC